MARVKAKLRGVLKYFEWPNHQERGGAILGDKMYAKTQAKVGITLYKKACKKPTITRGGRYNMEEV